MTIQTSTKLSANDTRILNALFDPETLPSSVARSKEPSSIDETLPPHPNIDSETLLILERQQNDIVREVSSSSDTFTINNAIARMDAVIEEWPTYPSAFVNRAMLHRMKLEARLQGRSLFDAEEVDVEVIFNDLSRAIHTSLSPTAPSSAVSTFQARILRTAFSHRGYLYLKAVETGRSLKGQGKNALEELASNDFASAARYGDEAAREMSVRTNPYAKMCGAIVRNALAEERKGEL
ncbi:hypothetical protein K491DRAFT_692629 [Lophiostoma macrostomum CBS 122681]|uniref:Uncharacterized protein n=1 Tax=Lophiostoma macrostomum CBS 122681 TaxID=1314788 RepID=A0A6A6T764_9PLEO|nr:hypothetical protein K491DRAFT_692629 [Lophiostoma macrostomum CBS 122681]